MKTRFAFQALIAVTFTLLPLLNGCTRQSASNPPPYVTTINPPPPPISTPTVSTVAEPTPPAPIPENVITPATPPLIISNAPPITEGSPVVPANLRISKPLSEVIRLAQSGVDEMVILTYITNSTTLFTLGAEEIVYLNDLGVTSPVVTAMMHRDQLLKSAWATARQATPQPPTNQETVAAAPTYVNPPQAAPTPEVQPVYVSNDYFYDTLTPYGTWVEVDGYGRCWRPTVAITSSSWQPYRDRGRWVYTDSGWYWMSDYSWGSVAFHYGRWFSHPRWGWCWWPDTTWGASWVTWRYDNDNCGWAPLPPRSYYSGGSGFYYHDRAVGFNFDFELSVGAFTFVPWGRFCDPYPYRYCLPPARSIAIYNQTTIINNVAVGNNNTIINRGIDKDRVRERSRAEVRTVQIREVNDRTARPRQEHFERDGRTLVVRRPQLAPTASTPVTERTVTRGESEQRDNRRNPRPATAGPVTTPTTPATPFTPVTPATIRTETAPVPERIKREQENSAPRIRDNKATVVRLPETRASTTTATAPTPVTPNMTPAAPNRAAAPTATSDREARRMETTPRPTASPTPVRTPTPIFSRPVVVETPAYTPTREVVTGATVESPVNNSRPNRSSARENSVWSSPTPQPNPVINAPNYNTPPSRQIEHAPTEITTPAPAFNRPNVEVRREDRINRNETSTRTVPSRAEQPSVAPSYTPPAPRVSAPVIAPAPAPAPAPRPSFTPTPTPSAPRIESSPAPSRSEPRAEQRSESRSESRAEPKSDSGRGPRNR